MISFILVLIVFFLNLITFILLHQYYFRKQVNGIIFYSISLCWLAIYYLISSIYLEFDFFDHLLYIPLINSSCIVYLLLLLVFWMYYFCVFNVSATNMVMYLLREEKELSFEEIKGYIPDKSLILPRLEQLIEDGYIRYESGFYIITSKGDKIVNLNILYQKLLGWKIGG